MTASPVPAFLFEWPLLVLACLAGVAAGVYLFFRGFQKLAYKRLILNTPLSKIHSGAIGLVEVTGIPTGPETLAAPVTGEACFYYRVKVWKRQESSSGQRPDWRIVLDETSYRPFFLEDSTGSVLVDPGDAEFDVHCSFLDEFGASFFAARDAMPERLRGFLRMRGLIAYDRIKIQEHILPPGMPLFVFGTLGEHPASPERPGPAAPVSPPTAGRGVSSTPMPEMQNARISKGKRGAPFSISGRSQKEVVETLAWKSTFYIWVGPLLAVAALFVLLVLWKAAES